MLCADGLLISDINLQNYIFNESKFKLCFNLLNFNMLKIAQLAFNTNTSES